MHTETQKAYMAGFIDGEGCIGIGVIKNSNGMGRHEMNVTITNTHLLTMEKLSSLWDGKKMGIRKRGDEWQPTMDLKWNSNAAVRLLKEVRPYLITKADQADVAFEFAETLNPKEHNTRPINKDVWEHRENLRVKLHTLKGKRPDIPAKYPEKPTLLCQYCGKEFKSYQKLRKYCSRGCTMDAGRDAYVDRHTYQKVCPSCGKDFTARLKQKYCSISCGRKMQAPPVPKGTKRN